MVKRRFPRPLEVISLIGFRWPNLNRKEVRLNKATNLLHPKELHVLFSITQMELLVQKQV